jgi:aspartate aminotransferase/aminotransferase
MSEARPAFSRRAREIPPALSIYVNEIVYAQKRRGLDVTTLSLGEAYFDIPTFDFHKIDFVRGYHYSDSQGLPELRRRIAQYYEQEYACPIDADREVLITAGSKVAIYLAILATVDAGCEVLIHEPAWLSYQEHVRLVDAEPRFIPFGGRVRPLVRPSDADAGHQQPEQPGRAVVHAAGPRRPDRVVPGPRRPLARR